jgi:hypothetical protein
MRGAAALVLLPCGVAAALAVLLVVVVVVQHQTAPVDEDGIGRDDAGRYGAPLWAHDGVARRTVCGPRGVLGVDAQLVEAYVRRGFARGPCGGAGEFTCEPLTELMCSNGTTFCASRFFVGAYARTGARAGACGAEQAPRR